MEDKELYQHILGLETPWSVAEVKLDLDQQQIDIHVSHPRGTKFCCPECNQSLSCYDHVPARKWRHLDSCQYKTILHASVPPSKVSRAWCEAGECSMGRKEQSLYIDV